MQERTVGVSMMYVSAFLLSLSPAALWADWQYTRWGMKPEEVIQASGKIAIVEPNTTAHSTETATALLTAPYTTGRFNFDVKFLFNKKTSLLARVYLSLLDPNLCAELHGALYSRYGKPESQNSAIMESSNWRDVQNNNGIALIKIGNRSCSVQYWPLIDKEKSGL